MKNQKGVVQAGAIAAIVAILGLTVAGAGYMVYKKNAPDVKVGSDGVEVNTNGVNVKTGSNGVSVDMDGVSVDTSDGVNVDMDGVDVDVDGNGVRVQTNGSATSTETNTAATPSVSTVLVFDASGSMAAQTQGGSRIQVAKNAVADYVRSLEGDVNLSVVAYGHKGDNTQAGKEVSCNGIEEIYYMGPVNGSVVTSKVNALNPNGWTPITKSLQRANDILQKSSGEKKHIILLSDGEETCGGDPVAYACQLKSQGIMVDVIGLNVTGVAENQLTDISECGGGEYYSVNGASDFGVVIDDMGVKVNTGDMFVDVSGDGAKVNTGNVDVNTNGSGAKVDAGNVKVDTTKGGMPSVKVPGTSIPSF